MKTDAQFDKHFGIRSHQLENLPDHTYQKKQRFEGIRLRMGLNHNGNGTQTIEKLLSTEKTIYLN